MGVGEGRDRGSGIMALSTVKGKKNDLTWEGQMLGSAPHCEIVWRFNPMVCRMDYSHIRASSHATRRKNFVTNIRRCLGSGGFIALP